jgi:sugar fermentation stimulation protein A
MNFDPPLVEGRLLRRYKRFLADVELDDGRVVVAHVPNTGSMRACSTPGSLVWLAVHDDPRRSLAFTLEIVRAGRVLVGVNTSRTNALVEAGLRRGAIPRLAGYLEVRREVRVGESRLDLHLRGPGAREAFVEIKHVSLVEDGIACFPDAVTVRGRKHVRELAELAARGTRAVLLFAVERADGRHLAPADHVDPLYGAALREAEAAGVEVLAQRVRVTPRGLALAGSVPVRLDRPPGQ